nr:hypothetical protein [Marinomonas vulgaris]
MATTAYLAGAVDGALALQAVLVVTDQASLTAMAEGVVAGCITQIASV